MVNTISGYPSSSWLLSIVHRRAEIIEYTSPDEIAVCNLASIALNMCVLPPALF
jgi:hypothetical protein